MHFHIGCEQLEAASHGHGSARTGTAGLGLSNAALIDAQTHMFPIEHLQEANVDLAREVPVGLQRAADALEADLCGLVTCVARLRSEARAAIDAAKGGEA